MTFGRQAPKGLSGATFLGDKLNEMAQHPVRLSLKSDQCRGVHCFSWDAIPVSKCSHLYTGSHAIKFPFPS